MNARLAFLGAVVCTAALAACGGAQSVPSAPSLAPAAIATTAPLSASTATPVQFGSLSNGVSAVVTLPAANAASSANMTFSTTLPTGVTQPQARAIAPSIIGGTNLSVLGYFTLQVNPTISISTTPAFAFTLPSAPTGSAYLAYFDEEHAANGWNVLAGPGTVSGTTLSFPSQAVAPPLTLDAGDTYVIALVVSSTPITPPPAAVSYQGTKTVSYAYGFAFDYPAPGPTVTAPPTTLSYAVTENLSAGASPFPGPTTAGLVDEHVTETDQHQLSSATYATDEWIGTTPSNGLISELLYGQTQTQTSSAQSPTFTTIFTTPQLVDKFPEASGLTWSNSPAASTSYSYASGDSGTRATNADGTYTDTESVLGVPTVISDNSDGSGSIVGPFFGGYVASLTFSAPQPVPSASPAITIAINFPAQASSPPPPVTFQDVVWYPTPATFYQESDTVATAASFPAACSNAYASSGNDVKRSVTTLDTAIGFIETTTFDTYTSGGIPVCMATNDVLNYAYDLQGNTPYLILYGPLGVETVTTNETLVLSGASSTSFATAAKHANAVSSAVSPAIAALQAHQLSVFARTRFAREHDVLTTLRTRGVDALHVLQGGH